MNTSTTCRWFVGVLAACLGCSVAHADRPEIRLDAKSLARLHDTNPGHYARAERILSAANELCRPGPEKLQFARADARDVSCARTLLRTSNPPQREIRFTLDHVRYAALVSVTDDPPKLSRAD